MLQELWQRLRRYLFIWLAMAAGVIIAAFVTRWDAISAHFARSAETSFVSTVMVLAMAALLLALIFGSFFPRR